jgi:anti-sigma B factor antagonist
VRPDLDGSAPTDGQRAVADAWLVELGGDIDLANATEIRDALCSTLVRRQIPLVVDLSEVTFIDSSAIAMMIAVHRYAGLLSLTVTWRNLRPQGRRVLEITAVDQHLTIVDER